MNYSPYGTIGETPKWRSLLYIIALGIITWLLGSRFDRMLYFAVPIAAGFIILFIAGINKVVRDPHRRSQLMPHAKWLICAAIIGNVLITVWKILGRK